MVTCKGIELMVDPELSYLIHRKYILDIRRLKENY